MQMVQGIGHITFFEPNRNNEYLIIKPFRLFQRDLQFLMAISLLFVKYPRETNDNHIAFEDCLANFILPILPGLEFFNIKPDSHSIFYHTVIEFLDSCLIIMCMANEDYGILFRW